ncbi:MAG: hypothetical protein RIR62_1828 [Pseudomonadota bacterium]
MKLIRACLLMLAMALPAQAATDIREITSPGGITAWLVESPDIPFTALEIRFRGGTSLDAPDRRGAVNLMTALIEEGAGDLDAQGFAMARDALAASFSFRADEDAVAVSARFLTENRDQAVELLRKALQEPRFDVEALERVRAQVLAGLRADEKDPDALAGRKLMEMAYGAHPYGRSGDGTIDSVTALTRDDMLAAHRAALARDRVYVAAAGDITAEELGLIVDRLLGALPETGPALPGRAEFLLTGGVSVIDFPNPQSTILFAQSGIRQDDPDYFAALVLNEVLGGGGFASRLMTELRERRGLTYGVGTGLSILDQAEMLMGQTSVPNDKVDEAIGVIRAEWQKLATEGITEQELADMKTYLTGSYPLRFDGNGPLASIMVGMQMIGLPPDYPKTRNAKVDAVTMEDVRRLAAELVDPAGLRFVVVGQPQGVTPTD